MNKLAAYEILLEEHPLWSKEAEKKYTGTDMALVGGGALGLGAGGGAVLGRASAEGDISRAKRGQRAALHQARMSDIRRRGAESSARLARSRARSAESSARFWRTYGRYF